MPTSKKAFPSESLFLGNYRAEGRNKVYFLICEWYTSNLWNPFLCTSWIWCFSSTTHILIWSNNVFYLKYKDVLLALRNLNFLSFNHNATGCCHLEINATAFSGFRMILLSPFLFELLKSIYSLFPFIGYIFLSSDNSVDFVQYIFNFVFFMYLMVYFETLLPMLLHVNTYEAN